MTNIQVGTVLVEKESLYMAEVFALESEPYLGNWSVVKTEDSFALDGKVHAAGWNFIFIAEEVKAMFWGAIEDSRIENALKRMLGKVKRQDFNCLEVTGITAKRFCGISYVTVSAHSRHIQQGWRLDDAEQRRAMRRTTEWARG